mgnify:FL=1
MHEIALDRFDLALLEALQRDGHATNAELGERVHLSASQVSRRIQRLEEAGLIAGYAALLAPASLGLSVTAFAHVTLERHGDTRNEAFESAVAALPQVLDCFAVSGDADYVLRIVAPDLASFSELMMKRVLRLPGLAQIRTNLALKTVKSTHQLPLDHLAQGAPRPAPRLVIRHD